MPRIHERRCGRARHLGVQGCDDRRWGDQNGGGPVLAGQKLRDKAVDDVNLHRNVAGLFAAGTGWVDYGQHGQHFACQILHHETADVPLWGGRSGDGLHWGGLEIRDPDRLLQSATWTVWAA